MNSPSKVPSRNAKQTERSLWRPPLGSLPVFFLLAGLVFGALSACSSSSSSSKARRKTANASPAALLQYKREVILEHSRELTPEQKSLIWLNTGRSAEEVDRAVELFLAENERKRDVENAGVKTGERHAVRGARSPYVPTPVEVQPADAGNFLAP